MKQNIVKKLRLMLLIASGLGITRTFSQTPLITLNLTNANTNVSPMLYGLMTEEINHSYDGGLYAELLRNRIFKDSKTSPEGWSLLQDNPSAIASMKLIGTEEQVPNDERRNAANFRMMVRSFDNSVLTKTIRAWNSKIRSSINYIW